MRTGFHIEPGLLRAQPTTLRTLLVVLFAIIGGALIVEVEKPTRAGVALGSATTSLEPPFTFIDSSSLRTAGR
jgi:hypothetical protein